MQAVLPFMMERLRNDLLLWAVRSISLQKSRVVSTPAPLSPPFPLTPPAPPHMIGPAGHGTRHL